MLISGYGPGISRAVAKRFGREGYQLALVARSQDKLEAAVKELGELGITAKAFPCDLGDTARVGQLVQEVRKSLGKISMIHWNAYQSGAGDVTSANVEELKQAFNVGVSSCVVAVQQALEDLKEERGALLITGGGFSSFDDQGDGMIVEYSAMGLGIVKAAQRKLAGVLSKKLAPHGVYVGQVLVLGTVKGTAFDSGNATLEADTVAEQFWKLASERREATAVCR